MQEVCDFLKKCGTYFLATTDGDQPRVRPFSTIHIYDNKLYFHTSKIKKVTAQLIKNPKIEISAVLGGQWLRLCALAIPDERIEAKQSMLNAYPTLQKNFKANDNVTQVFYLKNVEAAFFSFTAPVRIVRF